jgi:hypothetical protein
VSRTVVVVVAVPLGEHDRPEVSAQRISAGLRNVDVANGMLAGVGWLETDLTVAETMLAAGEAMRV